MSQSLRLNNLSKRFGDHQAVQSVSFEVDAGVFLALLGPSGCGKTTLLRCLAGLEEPTGGEIDIGGRTAFSSIKNEDLAPGERGLGFVFQDLGLWPHMTAEEHLMFVLGSSMSRDAAKSAALEQLKALKIDHLAAKKPGELSGGESQRLALARALVTNPGILLLDEPLASLDPSVAAEIRRLLFEIKEERKTTIVYVTHSRDEAMELGDQIAVMRDGAIEQMDDPETLYNTPRSGFVASFLGDATLIQGQVDRERGVLATAFGEVTLSAEAKDMKNPVLVARDDQVVQSSEGAPAKVERSTFRGGRYLLEVAADGLTLAMQSKTSMKSGDDIQVRIDGDLWFVEGDTQ